MGVGDAQLVRVVDDVIRHGSVVRDAMREATMVVDPLILGSRRGGAARAKLVAAASSDAAIAERLLQPIAQQEPALAPLLDALRSARAIERMKRPDQFTTSSVYGALQRELRAADAWKHVHGMDHEARTAAVARLRAMTADQLDGNDWKTLAGIVGDDVDATLTAGLPREPIGQSLSIRELALNVANQGGAHTNTSSQFFSGHAYFDAWHASTIDPAVRRARIGELLSGMPEQRTREEWRELTALLNAGGHDVVEHPWFLGMRPAFATRHAMLGGYDVLTKLRPNVDSASATQLDAARRQLLAPGELDDLARSIVQGDRLDRVGIVGEAAAAVRLRHLEPLYPAQAKAWLGDIGSALQRIDVDGPAAKLRASALELVEKNRARVDGERWWRWRDGYQTYPDHAELGRIRATWQLLEQLAAPPAPAPVAAADEAADLLRW